MLTTKRQDPPFHDQGSSPTEPLPASENSNSERHTHHRNPQPEGMTEGVRIVADPRAATSAPLEVTGSAEPNRRIACVKAVLAEHGDKILVLPAGRRLPIEALLDHLASQGYDWTELDCEVCFEERIDPQLAAGPWSAPDAPPCWRGMQGPLFHLWVTRGKPARRELLALIIPDQRSSPVIADAAASLEEEKGPSFEVMLSDLIVESAYRPSLAETDPAITSLAMPEGDGWVPRWWKLGTHHRWQYGWSRWK